ncbi:ion transporter [Rhodovibrionaceae bacterium A322]
MSAAQDLSGQDSQPSDLPVSKRPEGLRGHLFDLITNRRFQLAVTLLIVINAITLGLETSASMMASHGDLLLALDKGILAIFVLELALKIFVYGRNFHRDPWNLFDFIVVGVALIPAAGPLSVLRAFRILRVMRLVSVVPSMRRVVTALLGAIPGMGSVVALLGLLFYVFSVIATKLYGATFPDWFGSIGESAYSLFQIMTLESWSMGIVRPVMEAFPFAWVFFVPFILITSFAVLNLFIAIIVNAMQSQHDKELAEDRQEAHADAQAILKELKQLRSEVTALKNARQNGE